MGNTYTYTASGQGVAFMSSVLNDASVSYRSMDTSSADFKTKSKNLINDENKLNNTIIASSSTGTYNIGDINFPNGTTSTTINPDKK